MGKTRKLPKLECCVSKKRCDRCPLRMLKEGELPEGYTVKKRKLVRVDGKKVKKKQLAKAAYLASSTPRSGEPFLG